MATEQFDKAIHHLREELATLRTGRATPMIVEGLLVEYYGAKTPLLQLASISTPDAKSIVIQPWDPACSKDIEKAIQQSSLGLNPVNEGKSLRISIPALTEERRNDLVKVIGKIAEETRVRIRSVREDILKSLNVKKSEGTLSEDDFFRQQKELQHEVDENNKMIKEIVEAKEKELLTI